MNYSILKVIAVAGLCFPIAAQRSDEPLPCAQSGASGSDLGVSVVTNLASGESRIRFGNADPAADFAAPGTMNGLADVCETRDGRILLFGTTSGTLYNVEIIDRSSRKALDSFYAYSPALSPNRRWLVFRRFYPLHGVSASEQYFLYDIDKSAAENRGPGSESGITGPLGALVYPLEPGGLPGDNVGLPDEEPCLRLARILLG